MNKKIGLVLVAATFLFACKDKTKFTIDGKFDNPGAEKKVYLYGMENNGMNVIDSTTISEKGEFTFSRSAPESDFYRINFGTNEYIILAKNGEVVKLTADINDKNHSYKITGAEDADKLTEFNALKFKYQSKIEDIKANFEKRVAETPDKREQIIQELTPVFTNALNELNQQMINFANSNTSSLVSFYAISLINPAGNEKAMVDYAAKVDPKLKKNPMVANFVSKVEKLKAVQVGETAPDFSIPSVDGKTIKLSDYRGKYLLIDFWASWCGPCREENPNVVKAYNKFKDKNFTILGISLDKDKQAWQGAIKQDGLIWDHASELKDFEGEVVRLYQIEAIPSSFLLDPNGKIIARDLRGEELDQFLSKTLK